MKKFEGFPAGKVRFTRLPDPFFIDILPVIEHLGELKITLYAMWRLDHMEGKYRVLKFSDFYNDKLFFSSLGEDINEAKKMLNESLSLATQRGTLLLALPQAENNAEALYLLNTPLGRTIKTEIELGKWKPSEATEYHFELSSEPSNAFKLYEENIGPLTPMTAEMIRDAENSFPNDWIEEAILQAVKQNVRKWSYVEAILKNRERDGQKR